LTDMPSLAKMPVIRNYMKMLFCITLLVKVSFKQPHFPLLCSDKASPTTQSNTSFTTNGNGEHQWWQEFVEAASVLYEPAITTDWCTNTTRSEQGQNKLNSGMFYVKIPKSASSSLAGVANQIAESVAASKGLAFCPLEERHGDSYKDRKNPNFLWTMLRSPHKRSISSYFFDTISRRGGSYDSQSLINQLDREKNFQLEYISKGISFQEIISASISQNKTKSVQKIAGVFRAYNFIGVVERMDESLVVMKLLYGFEDAAMIVFGSKQSGSFDDGLTGMCKAIHKSYTTQDVDEHLAEGGTYRKTNEDYFLYAVANRNLDRTIDVLGRKRVAREVIRHRTLSELANKSCLANTIFPCTKDKAPRNNENHCYASDWGCGHKCSMAVIQNAVEGQQ